jgi:hypothetical protein
MNSGNIFPIVDHQKIPECPFVRQFVPCCNKNVRKTAGSIYEKSHCYSSGKFCILAKFGNISIAEFAKPSHLRGETRFANRISAIEYRQKIVDNF